MNSKKNLRQMNINEDTICAVATATGGAIGIIRLSGRDAIETADRIFTPGGRDKRPLKEREPYTMAFGRITGDGGETVDEVLVGIFRAPHSYTGEDSVEINCHGSAYILQKVMQLLADNGCRLAGPGEFTQRAFVNGKMDLSQAEAVADLIASTSEATHRMAMNQMRGAFSRELSGLRDKLLHLTSLLELELDFSDHEELEFADRSELDRTAAQIEGVIGRLAASFSTGNAIKNGVPVAIIGETNAGKSTLLNALLGEERAIVSDIHGTTRDVIEDTMDIDGVTFRFIDTAGIRETRDEIENLGIERTFQNLKKAEIVLLVVDTTRPESSLDSILSQVEPLCKGKRLIIVRNKSDLRPETSGMTAPEQRQPVTTPSGAQSISISAKHGHNIEALKRLVRASIDLPSVKQSDVIVSNIRHYDALNRAIEAIRAVRTALSSQLPADLVSQDLRATISCLNEIVGSEITSGEVLENIFKHFCVGK